MGVVTTGVLHDLLAASAERNPDAVAVVQGDRTMTMAELDRRSSQLSGLLAARGVAKGDRVGLQAEKSIESVVGLYGALKAGAIYVPLDPGAPATRAATIANDCDLRVLLGRSTALAKASAMIDEGAKLEQVVVLDAPGHELVGSDDDRPDGASINLAGTDLVGTDALDEQPASVARRVIDDDVAYILYTSGSTGQPKGVTVSHRNAMAFVTWAADEFALSPDDRVAQIAPLIFDLSTFDLFSTMAAGASLHIASARTTMFPSQFRDFLIGEDITVIYAVPSLLTMLAQRGQLDEHPLPDLRLVLFAGEVFPTRHLAQLMRLVPQAEFANLYGPTETNVCTFHRVTTIPAEDDPPTSIGKAIPGDAAIVVDESDQPVERGEPGELLIRGATVMQGYWGDPERSAKALVAPPGVEGSREPAYRTGDLVREEPDGTLTFLGRRDSQIKRQGYRIELGEIEAATARHPGVIESAATVESADTGDARIILHLSTADRGQVEAKTVMKHLGRHLPRYMLPDRIEIYDALPKTPTSKIDRVELARRAEVEPEVPR